MTSSWGALAAAWGNPTVDTGNTSFPFDRVASRVLEAAPEGLVASPAVLNEFLDPPDARGDWFCNVVYQKVLLELRFEAAVTSDEYQDLIGRFNTIQDALIAWTVAREGQDMSKGYAATIPDGMRKVGAGAWTAVFELSRGPLRAFGAKADLSDDGKQALDNLGQVLWEYVQCMAFELEASSDGIDVPAARDRFEAGTTKPWEPAVTPDNIGDGGIIMGAHRLPEAPSPTSDGTSSSGEPVATEPPKEPDAPVEQPPPDVEGSGAPVVEGGEVGE
jgi:hypothetical protein